MISCADWRLYVIVDRAAAREPNLAAVTAAAIRGGADVVQLRDKRASRAQRIEEGRRLLPLTRAAGIPLIINDDPEAACAIGAEGVHLGQEDSSVAEARRLLAPGHLIGKSTHSLEQALTAEAEGADYIGLGPVFPTPTKPEYPSVGVELIAQVVPRLRIPVVYIGGIEEATLPAVLAVGARCVAVVRAICASDDPEAATRRLKSQLLTHSHRAHLPTPL